MEQIVRNVLVLERLSMQRKEVYHEYCHHMAFLRAARNRIHNSVLSTAVKDTAGKHICEMVDKGYILLCKRGHTLTRKLNAALNSDDMDRQRRYMNALGEFNYVMAEYSVVLEKEIVPHEDFPDGYQVHDIDPHMQFDCSKFIASLTQATENIKKYCS